MSTQADLLFVNGNVLTMDPARPHATAVAVSGGRIHSLPADPARVPAAQVVDLHGMTVAPGFHDAHNHMVWFGLSLAEVDLRSPGIGSLDELYAAVARRAEQAAPGEWVVTAPVNRRLRGHGATCSGWAAVRGALARW